MEYRIFFLEIGKRRQSIAKIKRVVNHLLALAKFELGNSKASASWNS